MNTRTIATIAVVGVAIFLGATFWMPRQNSSDPFAPCRSSQVSGGAGEIGGAFTLVNSQNQEVTDHDVVTEPSILYFGYTFCPDICPFDAARNADAVDILAERGISATPVFISIDPERDTPDVMGDFAANMHPKMIGLTGSPEQVRAASRAYRTYYKKQDDGSEFYLVDHSTFSYLVLPEHSFVEFYRRDITADDMAKSVACFVENAG